MEDPMSCEAVAERRLVERYLAGNLAAEEVEAFESHYLTCTRCQEELRLGAGIREVLPEVRRARERAGRAIAARTQYWFRRPAWVGTAAAAAAAVLIGVLLLQPSEEGDLLHREGIPDSVGTPMPEAPAGEVRTAQTFRWSPVVGADLYRVTLYEADGRLRWEAETSETHLPLPDTVQLGVGALYLWRVDARVGWDRWVSSELVRFRIGETPSGRRP